MLHWSDEYSIVFFDKLDSTNLEAKRLINRGIKGKYLIVSSAQSLGHGRNGNSWHSPEGNLYFSVVFNHDNKLVNLSQLSLVVSLSCYEAVQSILNDNELSLFPRSFKIKWPNDLLLNDKKFCGILLKTVPHVIPDTNDVVNYLIIGIGLNLMSSPKNLDYLTTSLKEEGVRYNSRNEVLHQIMRKFNENYKLWKVKGFSGIRSKWMQNAYNIGEKVFLNVRGEKFSGLFKDIDKDGYMVVELESGILHKVATCDMQII